MKRLYKDKAHTFACHNRWQKKAIRVTGGPDYKEEWYHEQCYNCAYYIRLTGALIDDYGVCSNLNTPFDGLVRFEHDGCEKHDSLDEWIFLKYGQIDINPCGKETLHKLSKHYKLGLIADIEQEAENKLEEKGMRGYFSLIVLAYKHSAFSEILQFALNKAECDPVYATLVGDSLESEIKPAKSLGMYTILIQQGDQLPLEDVKSIKSFHELPTRFFDL